MAKAPNQSSKQNPACWAINPRPKNWAKPGTKPMEIDWIKIADLANDNNTITDIAFILGVSKDTLERRSPTENGMELAAFIDRSKAQFRAELRAAQKKSALEGNVDMQKHLGKFILDQKDQAAIEIKRIQSMSDDELFVEAKRVIAYVESNKVTE